MLGVELPIPRVDLFHGLRIVDDQQHISRKSDMSSDCGFPRLPRIQRIHDGDEGVAGRVLLSFLDDGVRVMEDGQEAV